VLRFSRTVNRKYSDRAPITDEMLPIFLEGRRACAYSFIVSASPLSHQQSYTCDKRIQWPAPTVGSPAQKSLSG